MYYVYFHRKASDRSVFYVGKGSGKRAYVKSNKSKKWKDIVNECGYEVEIIENNLSEYEAYERERFWVLALGRLNNGSGILINETDGGKGSLGRPMTYIGKQAISKSNSIRIASEKQRLAVGSLFKGKTGSAHNRSKKVICIETNVIYGSMSEASREIGCDASSISLSVRKNLSVYGLNFKIYE